MAKPKPRDRNPLEGLSYAERIQKRVEQQEAIPEIEFESEEQADTGAPAHQHNSVPVRQQDSTPAQQRTSKPVQQRASTAAGQQASTPVQQPDSAPAQQQASKPIKATFYFRPETAEALEEAWIKLRRTIGKTRQSQVSKSEIVETALLLALEDLEKNKDKSSIAGALAGQHDSTTADQ